MTSQHVSVPYRNVTNAYIQLYRKLLDTSLTGGQQVLAAL